MHSRDDHEHGGHVHQEHAAAVDEGVVVVGPQEQRGESEQADRPERVHLGDSFAFEWREPRPVDRGKRNAEQQTRGAGVGAEVHPRRIGEGGEDQAHHQQRPERQTDGEFGPLRSGHAGPVQRRERQG